MTYYSISALINASVSLLLGIFVLYKNPKAKLNKSLFFWCITVAFWSTFYFIWQLEVEETKALLWTRLLMLGAIWVPIAYFKVVVIFLGIEKEKKNFIIFNYILCIVFSLLLFTPLMVQNVEPLAGFQFWPKPGIVYAPFLFMFIGLSFYSVYLSCRALKKVSPLMRTQIKFMLFGIAISIAGGSTNYFLWYDIPIKPYGNILASAYVVFTIYAIIVHRLMDIKFVLRRSSVFLTSLSTIFILAISAQYISIIFFPNSATWINVLILILAVSFFPLIKNYYYRLASKYFFTSLYDGRTVIADLSDQLRSTLKAGKIYKYISATFINSFHAKAVGILTYDKKTRNYLVEYNKGFHFSRPGKIHLFSNFRNAFIKQNQPVVVEEIKHTAYKKYKKTIDRLTKHGIEILTPLNVKNVTVGLIVLGQKESGDMYNNEDLSVLKIIGAQAAIAIENALLYEETKNFTVKLKKEVKKATEDVKKANKQLRKLDAAKSNFISIASHQLRTPLTVIKGYISMMIEGSFGKVTKEELESLKKVYESNERLIRLVEDLLNISRIESGKLQFDFQETCLEEVVESVAEELAGSAKQKGLALEHKKLGQPLPMVKIDGEKIRYVILNLIDNAIKYTKQGSITVNLRLGKKYIYFCVVDTGIGIGEEDLSNLFKKFSRGKDISIVHTEGAGMGLYVGKMMIKAHHGKIWVESEGEGKGSKFCFKLPID